MRSLVLRGSVMLLGWLCLPACGSDAEQTPEESARVETVGESLLLPSLMPVLVAPAGDRPTTRHVMVDGIDTAVLPNGRLITPAGTEIGVTAPKPQGLRCHPTARRSRPRTAVWVPSRSR